MKMSHYNIRNAQFSTKKDKAYREIRKYSPYTGGKKLSRETKPKEQKEMKKKRTKIKRPAGQHQVSQNMYNVRPRGRGEKGAEQIFEKIMAKNVPNLLKNNLHIRNLNKLKVG